MSSIGSASYHITEPHPSVPSTRYVYSGRGGAGNFVYASPKHTTAGPDASGPASRAKLGGSSGGGTAGGINGSSSGAAGYFATGRGGAGNMFRERERAMFSFDEELEQQQRIMENAAPVYHVGRGGAGNTAAYSSSASSAGSAADVDGVRSSASSGRKSSLSSVASDGSRTRARRHGLEDAMMKVLRPFSRH